MAVLVRPSKERRSRILSWAAVAALIVMCGALAVLQYQWTGEVSVAERERLQHRLEADLLRAREEFNREITAAAASVVPDSANPTPEEYARRFAESRAVGRTGGLIARLGVAVPEDGTLVLHLLDATQGSAAVSEWPSEWTAARREVETRMKGEGWRGSSPDAGNVFTLPRFRPQSQGTRFERPEAHWLIIEFDESAIRESVLSDILERHLSSGSSTTYRIRVTTRDHGRREILSSEGPLRTPDAETGLYEIHFDRFLFRGGLQRSRGGGRGGRFIGGPEQGRWLLSVQHRTGSLDAVVAGNRRRNLAVAGGLIVLIAATAGALLRYTRQAQRLAAAQIDFVAGISHELKTPLTVIGTAAWNLRGRTAGNPVQVERYGTLIQAEAEKLGELVDQVVRFASSKTGELIQQRGPVAVETLIEDALEAARPALNQARADVHVDIAPGLPLILADPIALKYAIRNLLSNAAKYGTESDRWIGVSASRVEDEVEIRVADRGPGIPAEEKARIFEPFFRGRRAHQDQIHGTGLGLSIVRGIVEAHEGSLTVESEPMKGAAFTIRLAAAPEDQQDEFTQAAG